MTMTGFEPALFGTPTAYQSTLPAEPTSSNWHIGCSVSEKAYDFQDCQWHDWHGWRVEAFPIQYSSWHNVPSVKLMLHTICFLYQNYAVHFSRFSWAGPGGTPCGSPVYPE